MDFMKEYEKWLVSPALSAAGLAPELSVAPRDCLSPCHTVTRRCACRK